MNIIDIQNEINRLKQEKQIQMVQNYRYKDSYPAGVLRRYH